MAIQSPNLGGLLQAFGQLQQSNALVRARKDAAEQRANARRANTLRTIGTIGGAIAGASVAGPGGGVKGAAIGANIGSTAGGMIAGSRGYSQGPSANEVLQSGLQLSEFPTDERQAALKTQQEQAQEDAKLNRDYLIARTKALTPPTPVADQNAPFTTEEKRLAGVGAQLAQSLFGSNPSDTQPGPAGRPGGPVGGEQFRLKREQDTQDVQTLNSSLGELKQEFNAIEQSAVGTISKGRVGDTATATNNMKWLAEQIRNEPTIEGKQLLAFRSKGIMTQPLKEFRGLVRPEEKIVKPKATTAEVVAPSTIQLDSSELPVIVQTKLRKQLSAISAIQDPMRAESALKQWTKNFNAEIDNQGVGKARKPFADTAKERLNSNALNLTEDQILEKSAQIDSFVANKDMDSAQFKEAVYTVSPQSSITPIQGTDKVMVMNNGKSVMVEDPESKYKNPIQGVDEKGNVIFARYNTKDRKWEPIAGLSPIPKKGFKMTLPDGTTVEMGGSDSLTTGAKTDIQKNLAKKVLAVSTLKSIRQKLPDAKGRLGLTGRVKDMVLGFRDYISSGTNANNEKGIGSWISNQLNKASLNPEEKEQFEKWSVFEKEIQRFKSLYRIDVTGAQAAMKEISYLESQVINENMGQVEFEAVMNGLVASYEREIKVYEDLINEGSSPSDKGYDQLWQKRMLEENRKEYAEKFNEEVTKLKIPNGAELSRGQAEGINKTLRQQGYQLRWRPKEQG